MVVSELWVSKKGGRRGEERGREGARPEKRGGGGREAGLEGSCTHAGWEG